MGAGKTFGGGRASGAGASAGKAKNTYPEGTAEITVYSGSKPAPKSGGKKIVKKK